MKMIIGDIEQKDTLSGRGKVVTIPAQALISAHERKSSESRTMAEVYVEVTITSDLDGHISTRTEVKR